MSRSYVTETVFDCRSKAWYMNKLWTASIHFRLEQSSVRRKIQSPHVQQRGKAEIRVISDHSPARIWINELNEESTKIEASGRKRGPHRPHSISKSNGSVCPAKKQENWQQFSYLVHGDGGALLSAVRTNNHESPATNLERLINEGVIVDELADTSHQKNWLAEVSELQFMDCYKCFSV